jgi:glutathione S-transferase
MGARLDTILGAKGKRMSSLNYRLVIGNKTWSSWSLRPWLLMKRLSIPFEEVPIRLRQPDSKEQILTHSPSGKVPALWAGDLMVWDSLAIIEYLADAHPELNVWPRDRTARAIARSASAEMHAGFRALRETCPMEILTSSPQSSFVEATARDIQRVVALWKDCRTRFGAGGPFLFSEFSAADAMYAPVASRFRTYVEDLSAFGDDGTAAAYVETILTMPEVKDWIGGAEKEVG